MKKWSLGILLLLPLWGFCQNWVSDFDNALAQSSKESKPLILVFSGSDWCAPCMKLEKTIWQSDTFKAYSSENYILYKADFPKKKKNHLSTEILTKNKELAERYNPQGYFPLVLVLDKEAQVLGTTGYKRVGPKKYVQLLDAFLQ
jgi:thioredoxin-related protein